MFDAVADGSHAYGCGNRIEITPCAEAKCCRNVRHDDLLLDIAVSIAGDIDCQIRIPDLRGRETCLFVEIPNLGNPEKDPGDTAVVV